MAEETLCCPIHGEVEGLSLSEGPLSNCWPWVLVCEECDPNGHAVVVGYEGETDDDNDSGFSRDWEDAPHA